MAMEKLLLWLSINKLKLNNMKNLYIIMLFPTLMFGQVKQVNTVLYDDVVDSSKSRTSLELEIQEAINFHNTIRVYQLNTLLEYDQNLSISAKQWAENVIKTGDLDYDTNIPGSVGELLYRVDTTDEIPNYNPYLDATTYWATNGGSSTMSFDEYESIGMGVAYGNGKVVVVARYE